MAALSIGSASTFGRTGARGISSISRWRPRNSCIRCVWDPEGLFGSKQPQTGHLARIEFKRRLEKDAEAREAFENHVREEQERRRILRQSRELPETPAEMIEYFLDTEAQELEFEIARLRPRLNQEFFSHLQIELGQLKFAVSRTEAMEDRLAELETMQKVLLEGTEAHDKMQVDLIKVKESLTKILTSKDVKATLLEMVERNELNRSLLALLDENIANAHKTGQKRAAGFMEKVRVAVLSPIRPSDDERIFSGGVGLIGEVAKTQKSAIQSTNREMWRRVVSLYPLLSLSNSSVLHQMQAKGGIASKGKTAFITFVLGGPGSGKGTQCAKIVETFGFTHLSAGDILRREISSNSENGAMILDMIKEGKVVPSEVTVKLIQKEIESIDNYKFLIDGFPRSEENRIAFERNIGMEPNIVLFFDCPEDEMVKRVLSRNEGRVDDNVDTIKKRLNVFAALNLPVIKHYTETGKVHKINAVGSADEIFEQIRPIFTELMVK
ncbi:hypothetical protein NE237_030388 [Protea cynaroides]|uniref:UMP-CMP kinase n=1 Tax=Protea cynaroides TaxID=273540 RepID=A0A9Q0GSZ6_9MAGN|nr:hypothetical protein NE237_030388 [Protea cynaroides]